MGSLQSRLLRQGLAGWGGQDSLLEGQGSWGKGRLCALPCPAGSCGWVHCLEVSLKALGVAVSRVSRGCEENVVP